MIAHRPSMRQITWTIFFLYFFLNSYSAIGRPHNDLPPPSVVQLENPEDILSEMNNENIEEFTKIVTDLLSQSWSKHGSPLVYIEQPYYIHPAVAVDDDDFINEINWNRVEVDDDNLDEYLKPNSIKRSKYYRKYPYKRQNSRYEPPYMCVPKKDDVFRLLVALHSERNGKRGQLVDFCNRKRPASVVFTNIRFIG